MNKLLPKGFRLVLFFILLFSLISANYPANVGLASTANPINTNLTVDTTSKEKVNPAGISQSGDPPGVDPDLIKRLKQNAHGNVSISIKHSTEFASFVSVSKGGDLQPGNRSKTPQGKAMVGSLLTDRISAPAAL